MESPGLPKGPLPLPASPRSSCPGLMRERSDATGVGVAGSAPSAPQCPGTSPTPLQGQSRLVLQESPRPAGSPAPPCACPPCRHSLPSPSPSHPQGKGPGSSRPAPAVGRLAKLGGSSPGRTAALLEPLAASATLTELLAATASKRQGLKRPCWEEQRLQDD